MKKYYAIFHRASHGHELRQIGGKYTQEQILKEAKKYAKNYPGEEFVVFECFAVIKTEPIKEPEIIYINDYEY